MNQFQYQEDNQEYKRNKAKCK